MNNIYTTLLTIKKALVAAAAAVGVTATAYQDNIVTTDERNAIIFAWLAVVGVYSATNRTK